MPGKVSVGQIALLVATNTALFSALDLAQWVADRYSLWMLPANIIAAIVATTLALALGACARVIGVSNVQA